MPLRLKGFVLGQTERSGKKDFLQGDARHMSCSPFSSSTQARLAVRFSLLALVFGSATSVMLQGPSTPLPVAVVQAQKVQHGRLLALSPSEEKPRLVVEKTKEKSKKLPEGQSISRTSGNLTLEHYTRCVARELDVDEGLAVSVLIQESDANNPMRRGKRGSRGPLQIQPIALEEVGLSRHERSLAILVYGGLRYLKTMMMRFDTLDTALAAYNMGPTSLVRRDYRPYRVTRRYVQQILNRAGKIRSGDVPLYPVLQYSLSKRDLPAKHHQLAPLQACLV